MSGYALGQSFGYGLTEQSTITPGQGSAAAAPAAGASYTLTLERYNWWRLVFCTFTLTTDANAANRYVTVEYPGGDGVSVLADAAAVIVTASTTNQRYVGSLNRGVSEWNANADVLFPLSGIMLEAGRTVKINVANIQVGDQLSKIRLTFDRVPVRDPVQGGWSDPAAGQE